MVIKANNMPIRATASMNFENRPKKDHVLYESIYRKCPKRAQSIEAEKRPTAGQERG